uniref:Transmembrane protein n=1 Tax=Medicago truncatula TaxID=3880 RepID=I3S3R2_MEDTR|nr:unknown [Medicago truncatula]
MIHMFVNLLCLSVLAKQTPEDTHSPHPKDFGGEPSLSCTLSLSISRMTSLPLGLLHAPSTGAGVNLSWLPDNEAILNQLPDVLA